MVIEKRLLTPSKWTRPQIKLDKVDHIVIHWVANPKSTAIANRNYFNNIPNSSNPRYASAHFIVGLDGEVVQCLPIDEVAYHTGTKSNNYTIGIEVCHPDSTGKFSDITMKSLIELCRYISRETGVDLSKTTRHYDENLKNCPQYYVQHEDEWLEFKKELIKMDIPQWKLDACNRLISRIGLDNTWKDKLQDGATIADIMVILNKALDVVENAKIKVGE